MIPTRILAAALAITATAAVGCGIGPGGDEGDVELTVTRDYGERVLLHEDDSIRGSDTVMRVLDRTSDIETRYGGGFVQSIDGLAGGSSGGRRSDWFFYVNGIESPLGAAQYDPSGGDRIWWDYRDWAAAMRVPAVVGSWPEPFLHGFQGKQWTAAVSCEGPVEPCKVVQRRLKAAAVVTGLGGSLGTADIVVGPWENVRRDQLPRLLAAGPDRSGVFARFVGARRPLLELLNQRGEPAGTVGKGGGLVAALRAGDGPPVWVVTGTDAKGVAAAANLLGDGLRNHYAVATQPGARCEGARQRNPCYVGVPVP